ncbi:MAG: hypothetical protein IPL84_08325 [Chitinophagaceae bacterium]|nr:hypothetical protein [Chitinophagaceae bacterium]
MLFGQVIYSCTSTSSNEAAFDIDSAKIELGRFLFFDRRLSVNNTRSCGTCHNPQFAFTDGYKRSLGVYADLHQRNTQPLFNLAYLKYFTAADSTLQSSLQQMNNPLFNDHPAEMGVKGNEEKILQKIATDENVSNNVLLKLKQKFHGSISSRQSVHSSIQFFRAMRLTIFF